MIEFDERVGAKEKIVSTIKNNNPEDLGKEIERLKKENEELKGILKAYKQMLK